MIDIIRHRTGRHGRLPILPPRRTPPRRPLNWDRLEERTLLDAAGLDPSFGTGGNVVTNFPYHDAPTQATSMVIDAQGRAIVAGVVNDAQGNERVVLARYEPDGALDAGFGDGGVVYTSLLAGGGFEGPEAAPIALDSSDRILVAGDYTWPPVYGPYGFDVGRGPDFAVIRLKPDGTLDTSFGTGGEVTIDVGLTDPTTGLPVPSEDEASGITVQPDGKIVVSGTTVAESSPETFVYNPNFALVRLEPDGRIDTGFGTDGRAIADFPVVSGPYAGPNSLDTATSLALAPDGTIVVAGITVSDPFNEQDDFAVARFNADGSLDSGFGNDGMVFEDLGGGQPGSLDHAYAVVVQPDDKIVLGGTQRFSFDPSDVNFAPAPPQRGRGQ